MEKEFKKLARFNMGWYYIDGSNPLIQSQDPAELYTMFVEWKKKRESQP
jgi:hypothetical protein